MALPIITPLAGVNPPTIAAPKQAKNIFNFLSGISPNKRETCILTFSCSIKISLSFFSNLTSSSVFCLLSEDFFLVISCCSFVSISSWANWDLTKPA